MRPPIAWAEFLSISSRGIVGLQFASRCIPRPDHQGSGDQSRESRGRWRNVERRGHLLFKREEDPSPLPIPGNPPKIGDVLFGSFCLTLAAGCGTYGGQRAWGPGLTRSAASARFARGRAGLFASAAGGVAGEAPRRGEARRGRRRVVRKRKRAGLWRRRFLRALARTANARLSAAIAGVDHTTAYQLRERDPVFAAAW